MPRITDRQLGTVYAALRQQTVATQQPVSEADVFKLLAQIGDRQGGPSASVLAQLQRPDLSTDAKANLIRLGMSDSERATLEGLVASGDVKFDVKAQALINAVLGHPVTPRPTTPTDVLTTPVVPSAPATPVTPNVPAVDPISGEPTAPTTPALPKPAARIGNVIHSDAPTAILGPKLTPAALEQLNGLAPEKFGTTTLSMPQPDGTTKTYVVRDMQYDLGDGTVGVRLVPIKDGDAAASAEMDALIRKESGLAADEPIYAFVAYIHPEEHQGTVREAGERMLKPEMGNTHLGAYVGGAKTTNSPEGYHNKTWGTDDGKPYPANVQIISLEGVKQAELNKNLVTADAVLNDGVKFPSNYKNDPFRTVDLNTTLMFYRDWLKQEPYLKEDGSWATYCAEHKTIAANIGLNVPHNLESFKETFGDDEGAKLFDAFKARFEKVNGRAFTAADETHFEPLWKKEGLTAAQIRPPSKADYDAYQAARFDGSLSSGLYSGFKPLPPGKGMAWRPETTADLVKNFMETYASFKDVGGYASVAAIMGFKDQIKERTGLNDEAYVKTAMPVLNKIMMAEAMARAPADPAAYGVWAQKATAGLYLAFGGKMEDLAPGATPNPQLMGLAQACMTGAAQAQPLAAQTAALPADKRETTAYGWLRGSIEKDLEAARAVMVANPSYTEAYSPPAVTNRVINGLVEKSAFVTMRVVATAIDAKFVQ